MTDAQWLAALPPSRELETGRERVKKASRHRSAFRATRGRAGALACASF
jgi:hypothetical protein